MKYQLEALVRSRLHRTGFSSTPRSGGRPVRCTDRKSTRLNSSHGYISYAVFCLKKKNTVRHPRRFTIVVIDIQITLKQMLRDFIGIRVNRAKKSGMVNITSSVNSRERSGINTILHELNPLFTINVTMSDIKSKNFFFKVNGNPQTQPSSPTRPSAV